MKHFRTLLIMFVMLLGITCSAKQSDRIIIFNGHFFKELPAAAKNSSVAQTVSMFFVRTDNNTKATGLYSPSIELTEDALQYAIPVKDVPEGEELLRRYNEEKDKPDHLSFTIEASEALVKVGDTFPEFSATDISGKTWTNADVKDKVMVLNLWFSGCGPCRSEMPELSSWKDEMPDVMFFSSTYESAEVAQQVFNAVNYNWIPLVNDTQFTKFIGKNGYPLTIVIDKSGKIAAFEYGTSPEQRATLKNKILELR